MANVFIGIDPGANGGIALIDGDTIAVVPFTKETFESELVHFLIGLEATTSTVCVEKVGAMPGQGVTSMFNFGKNAGFIEGVLQAFNLSYQLVPPQKWKKEFSVSKDKNTSIAVCQKLFPKANLYRTERCKKPHDGMAEALLMAEYARRKFGKG